MFRISGLEFRIYPLLSQKNPVPHTLCSAVPFMGKDQCFSKGKSVRALTCGKGFISDDGLLHNQQLPSALPFHEKGESFLVLFLL